MEVVIVAQPVPLVITLFKVDDTFNLHVLERMVQDTVVPLPFHDHVGKQIGLITRLWVEGDRVKAELFLDDTLKA